MSTSQVAIRTSLFLPLTKSTILDYSVAQVEAAVSVEASFNDSRCDRGMVCPNDPLLYTCTVSNSPISEATLRLSSGHEVDILSDGSIAVTAGGLPDGLAVQFFNAAVDGGLVNYTVMLLIETASLLNDGVIVCDPRTFQLLKDEATCPVATGTGMLGSRY